MRAMARARWAMRERISGFEGWGMNDETKRAAADTRTGPGQRARPQERDGQLARAGLTLDDAGAGRPCRAAHSLCPRTAFQKKKKVGRDRGEKNFQL